MKIRFLFMLCVVLFVTNVRINAQDNGHYILDEYNVLEISGEVFTNVTVSSGNTCKGIKVWRSEDDLNFNLVGEVLGICGSLTVPVSYRFIDKNPIKNKESYYKVELGGVGFTTSRTVNIADTKEYGFQVTPNPANEKAIVYFENPQQESFELELYNLSGAKIGVKQSSSNSFEINTSELNKGMYFFSIGNVEAADQGKKIGKLMIQH